MIKNMIEATPMQENIYYACMMNLNITSYNISWAIEIEGIFDVGHFETCVQGMIDKYDVFRTTFTICDEKLYQQIHDQLVYEIIVKDLSFSEISRNQIDEWINSQIVPFPIKDDKFSLFRIGLLKLESKYIILFDMHHLIFDGISMQIYIKELLDLYMGNSNPGLEAKQYSDYCCYLSEILQKTEESKFWQKQFLDEPSSLVYEVDDETLSAEAPVYEFEIDETVLNHVKSLQEQFGITEYMFYLGVFNILLSKYCCTDDICIATPVSLRDDIIYGNVIGNCVNTLLIRSHVNPEVKFSDYIGELRNLVIESFDHKEYSLSHLMDFLHTEYGIISQSFINTMFIMQNYDTVDYLNYPWKISNYEFSKKSFKYDLSFYLYYGNKKVKGLVEYNNNIFNKRMIRRLIASYRMILMSVISNPYAYVKDIEILQANEKRRIISEFNNTLKWPYTFHSMDKLFADSLARKPYRTAIIDELGEYSYDYINMKINELIPFLINKGVVKNEIVALYMERSVDMIIAIMALMRLGAAYLPININSPLERIRYILWDSNAKFVFTSHALKLSGIDNAYCIRDCYCKDASDYIACPVDESSLIYVIYTSGSSGKPKGVLLQAGGVYNRLLWMAEQYRLNKTDIFIQKTDYSFDVSVWELFLWLFTDGKLFMLRQGDEKRPQQIIEMIEKHGITAIHFVPSMFFAFLNTVETANTLSRVQTLRNIFCSGEVLGVDLVDRALKLWPEKNILHNLYGPTEATVDVTYYPCNTHRKIIPIGKPIYNNKLWILDQNLKIQPIGIRGDLYISGMGVARGYLNNPVMTKEKFINNPYEPESVLYKTGDIAKWDNSGNVIYLGRSDHQVKVRGFRIEIQDIETHISEVDGIDHAIVIAQKDNAGSIVLVAYYIGAITPVDLRERLKDHMLEYMLPELIYKVTDIPVNKNGKVDIKTLAELPLMELNTDHVIISDFEKQMLTIWRKSLMVETIGLYDDFLITGGNSIKAINLANDIRNYFGVDIELSRFFDNLNVKKCCDLVKWGVRKAPNTGIVNKDNYKSVYPASSEQRAIYIASKLSEHNNDIYCISFAMFCETRIDEHKLSDAISYSLRDNHILRTHFEYDNVELLQVIGEDTKYDIFTMDERNRDLSLDQAAQQYESFYNVEINVEDTCLFDVKLMQLRSGSVVFFKIHHILVDGLSVSIWMQEILSNYESLEKQYEVPQRQKLQYADYAEWQVANDKNEKLNYWKERFSHSISPLELPTDYVRSNKQNYCGAVVLQQVESRTTDLLYTCAQDEKVSIFNIFLTTWAVLLYKYTGQEEFTIGTVVSHRPGKQFQDTVGLFIHTIPLILRIDPDERYTDLLNETYKELMIGIEMADVGFDEIVSNIDIVRDASRNPVYDVMIVQEIDEMTCNDYNITSFNQNMNTTKCDLILQVTQRKKDFVCEIIYDTDLFCESYIKRMMQGFVKLLNDAVTNSTIMVVDMCLIKEKELMNRLGVYQSDCDRRNTVNLYEQFKRVACLYPENIAIENSDMQYTYKQTVHLANQISTGLIKKGVIKGEIIGLNFHRDNPFMIITMLALLRIGSPYVSLNFDDPKDRVDYIIQDGRIQYIIMDEPQTENKIALSVDSIMICAEQSDTKSTNLIESTYDDAAYIIYTSGTTGRPKGVIVEQQGIDNLIRNQIERFQMGPTEHVLLFTTTSFDASVEQIYIALFSGATLVLTSKDVLLDPHRFDELIDHKQITHLNAVPSFLNTMHLENNHNLKRIISGGEKFDHSILRMWEPCDIYNQYGPTETTVTATSNLVRNITGGTHISIGKPLENVYVLILDKNMNLLPPGIPGEVYIGGIQVARGYLNNPILTDERFITISHFPQYKFYKTGDIAKWDENFEIIYLGRHDRQVKIRGFRIELDEIEQQMKKVSGVNGCVVLVKEVNGKESIVAFVEAAGNEIGREIRTKLQKQIPHYMIPDYYVAVDTLPYLHNGKINMAELSGYRIDIMNKIEEGPVTLLEKQLLEIWKKVLNLSIISLHDDFFSIGGNSLLIVKLQVELQNSWINVEVQDLYTYSTIKRLADYLVPKNQDVQGNQKQLEIFNLQSSQNENENKNILKNDADDLCQFMEIEPFNEFLYENCFYNLCVSVVKAYGIDENIIFSKDLYAITMNDTDAPYPKLVQLQKTDLLQNIMEFGFEVELEHFDDEIITKICNHIDSGNLLIIGICKADRNQYALVYGYNYVQRNLLTIVQKIPHTLSYEKEIISFDEIKVTYKEFCRTSNEEITACIFQNTGLGLRGDYLGEYIAAIQQNENVIYDMFDSFRAQKSENFIDNLAIIMQEKIDLIIEEANRIVTSKKILSHIFKNSLNKDLVKKISEGIVAWDRYRQYVARVMYTTTYDKVSTKKISALFNDIYVVESEILSMICNKGIKYNIEVK